MHLYEGRGDVCAVIFLSLYAVGYLDLSHLNASASEVNIQYRNSHLALTVRFHGIIISLIKYVILLLQLIGISSAPGPLENSSGIRFERGGIIDVMNLNTNNGVSVCSPEVTL